MKQLLPLLLFIICGSTTMGQDYQVLKSNEQYLHNMAVGHAGLEVKHVDFDGDSIFWLAPHWVRWDDDWECYYPDSSSMLGRKVRIATDGTTTLYTANDETITLLTQRYPGDEPWIAYTAADGAYYLDAFVSGAEIQDVLGQTDSVKTFNFQAFNPDGTPATHWFENQEIRIAKNAGLVHSPQLGTFPGYSGHPAVEGHFDLSGIEGLSGVQNIRMVDVYDFDVDDEIHIEQISSSYGVGNVHHTIRKYLSRQDYPDSVVYEVEVKRWSYQGPMTDIDLVYQGTNIETQAIYNNSAFDALPGTPVVQEYEPGFGFFGGYYKIGSYQGFPAKFLPAGAFMFHENPDVSDGCFTEMIDWGCFSGGHTYYVKGLGGPYSFCSAGAPEYTSTSLMYFNKSGVEWGSPLSTSALERLSANALKAYPNPARQSFRLGLDDAQYPLQLELYDLSGKRVAAHTLNTADEEVPVQQLAKGIFMIRAIQRDGGVAFGKIVVQ